MCVCSQEMRLQFAGLAFHEPIDCGPCFCSCWSVDAFPGKVSRVRAWTILDTLANGDWQKHGVFEHYLQGGMTAEQAETLILEYVPLALLPRVPGVLRRGKWLDAAPKLAFFLRLHFVHDLLRPLWDCFMELVRAAPAARPQREDPDEHDRRKEEQDQTRKKCCEALSDRTFCRNMIITFQAETIIHKAQLRFVHLSSADFEQEQQAREQETGVRDYAIVLARTACAP